MKKYCVLVVLLCCGLIACERYSEEVEVKLDLAEFLMTSRPDSVIHILENIKNTASLSDIQYATYCLLYVSAQDKLWKPLASDSLINIAVNFFSQYPDKYPKELVRSLYLLGRYYQETGRREEAMQLYLELEPRAETIADNDLLGLLNSRVGRLLRKQNMVEESTSRYKAAVLYFEKSNNQRNKGYAMSNIGYNFLYLKCYDSVIYYASQSKTLAIKIADTVLLSQSLVNLGIAYFFENKFRESITVLLQANKHVRDDERQLQIYNYLTEAYIELHELDTAALYTYRALEISKEKNNFYGLANTYKQLYTLELKKGKMKEALAYYCNFAHFKDSIATMEHRTNVFAVQEKYKLEKLRAENIQLVAAQQFNRFMLVVVVLILIVLLMVLLLYKSRQQQKSLQQKALILKQEARLKEILLKRLEAFQKIVEIRQAPAIDTEKNQQKLKSLLESLSFNPNDRKELINVVNELFNNFADKLIQLYPELTSDEIQLCCMVRAGFDAGIIATVLGINLYSLYTKRSRLRKRINLDREQDFETFLMNI